jgi:large subunit ribosomal protein L10
MTRAQKATAIEELKEQFSTSPFFYLTDSSSMTVEQISRLRRLCFSKGINVKVVKNTLAIKALEAQESGIDYSEIYKGFKGNTAILFSDTANLPGKVLKEFRGKDGEKPILKAAYIDTDVYFGDDRLTDLATLKSKEDLVGEIIGLLQSPAKNVISALKSGGNTLSGLLKTLESR